MSAFSFGDIQGVSYELGQEFPVPDGNMPPLLETGSASPIQEPVTLKDEVSGVEEALNAIGYKVETKEAREKMKGFSKEEKKAMAKAIERVVGKRADKKGRSLFRLVSQGVSPFDAMLQSGFSEGYAKNFRSKRPDGSLCRAARIIDKAKQAYYLSYIKGMKEAEFTGEFSAIRLKELAERDGPKDGMTAVSAIREHNKMMAIADKAVSSPITNVGVFVIPPPCRSNKEWQAEVDALKASEELQSVDAIPSIDASQSSNDTK